MNVDIELTEPVSLTFSLKYLVNFCKAAALSTQVKICLSNEVPLLVEYNLSGSSYLRFYLAPKVRQCPARLWCLLLTTACRLATRSKTCQPAWLKQSHSYAQPVRRGLCRLRLSNRELQNMKVRIKRHNLKRESLWDVG